MLQCNMEGMNEWRRPETAGRRLSLALQGGGAFGAMTWGVLSRLLQEPALQFDVISGTSAGAVNAVLLADGLAEGGAQAAQKKLDRFWTHLGDAPPRLGFGLVSPWFSGWDAHPLRRLLESQVDFERLRTSSPVGLILNATRIRDGRPRLFREHELTADMVMASACLPNLGPPIEIDGEFYWDGGYTANPPLQPLALASRTSDLLLVQIMPENHAAIPRTPLDIAARTATLAFNAGLQRELAALDDLCSLAREKRFFRSPKAQRLARLRLHRIRAADYVEDLDRENPLSLDPRFLHRLHESGLVAGGAFLDEFLASEASRA
jgi:NTE family protein